MPKFLFEFGLNFNIYLSSCKWKFFLEGTFKKRAFLNGKCGLKRYAVIRQMPGDVVCQQAGEDAGDQRKGEEHRQ